MGHRRSREEKDKILTVLRERYLSEGPAKLAEDLGLSENAVRLIANRAGLQINSKIRYEKMSKTMNERYDVNPWTVWNPLSNEGAYYLGLLWADGTVTEDDIVIGLSGEEDHEVLYYLAERVGLRPERVRSVKKYKETHKQRKELKLCGKRIVTLMQSYGIFPRKSYIDPPFPEVLPEEFLADFLRGVFDGDGSVKKQTITPSIRIYGSDIFMHTLIEKVVIRTEIIQYSLIQRKDSLWLFEVGHPLEVLKVINFMHYQRGGPNYPFIKRKHQPLLEFVDNLLRRERVVRYIVSARRVIRPDGLIEYRVHGDE